MNGLMSKKDIDAMFKLIGNLEVYYVAPESGFDLAAIYHRPETGALEYVFEATENQGYAKIRIKVNAKNDLEKNIKDAKEVMNVNGASYDLYEWGDKNDAYDVYGYLSTENNSAVYIQICDKEDISVIEKHLTVTTLSELIK